VPLFLQSKLELDVSLLVFLNISCVYFGKGFRQFFELLISLFGVFSYSLRSAVGQRSVSLFSCIFIFSSLKKRRKIFILIFSCLQHFQIKKDFPFLVW
jgi:hypothetical protein